jgi:hypothetical protein
LNLRRIRLDAQKNLVRCWRRSMNANQEIAMLVTYEEGADS